MLGTEPHAHLQLQIRQKVRQMQNSFQNLQFLPFHGDDVEVKMDIQITQFIRLVQVPLSFLASAKQLKTPPPILRVLDAKKHVAGRRRSRKHNLQHPYAPKVAIFH